MHHFLYVQDLNKLKAFGAVEGVQVSLSVYRWQGQIPEQTGMIFRGFVYKVSGEFRIGGERDIPWRGKDRRIGGEGGLKGKWIRDKGKDWRGGEGA